MNKKVKITIILEVMIAILMLIPITSNAALQANGKSTKTDTLPNWLLNIRKMEAGGGTLGLTDTINETDLTSSADISNNLDIHMELNTEYGAMAILSASAYGKQDKIADGQTTTGNKSGVYMNLNGEWVSAGVITYCSQYVNANAKYKNQYNLTYTAKVGDAITETSGWHQSTASAWLVCNEASGLLRAYSGSIFSYWGQGHHLAVSRSWEPIELF